MSSKTLTLSQVRSLIEDDRTEKHGGVLPYKDGTPIQAWEIKFEKLRKSKKWTPSVTVSKATSCFTEEQVPSILYKNTETYEEFRGLLHLLFDKRVTAQSCLDSLEKLKMSEHSTDYLGHFKQWMAKLAEYHSLLVDETTEGEDVPYMQIKKQTLLFIKSLPIAKEVYRSAPLKVPVDSDAPESAEDTRDAEPRDILAWILDDKHTLSYLGFEDKETKLGGNQPPKKKQKSAALESVICNVCLETGHFGANCPDFLKKVAPSVVCSFCGDDHYVVNCSSVAKLMPSAPAPEQKASETPPPNQEIETCQRCDRQGHGAASCKAPFCRLCDKFGHLVRTCPTYQGGNTYQRQYNPTGRERPPNQRTPFTGTCYNCGKANHRARDCFSQGGGASQDGNNQNRFQNRNNQNRFQNENNQNRFQNGNNQNYPQAGNHPNFRPPRFPGANQGNRNSTVTCYLCRELGHYANVCPKRNTNMNPPSIQASLPEPLAAGIHQMRDMMNEFRDTFGNLNRPHNPHSPSFMGTQQTSGATSSSNNSDSTPVTNNNPTPTVASGNGTRG